MVTGERFTFEDGSFVLKETIDSIRDATEKDLKSNYPENVVEKIMRVNRSRKEELESRKYMSSCPERTNSYGRFPFFEKKVNEKYDQMLARILHSHVAED